MVSDDNYKTEMTSGDNLMARIVMIISFGIVALAISAILGGYNYNIRYYQMLTQNGYCETTQLGTMQARVVKCEVMK